VALGILVILHLLGLRYGTENAYLSPDGGGYAVQARLLATHGRTELKLESDLQYVGGHWLETLDGRYFCQYPPGFSLLQAAAYLVLGSAAALWTASLLAAALLILKKSSRDRRPPPPTAGYCHPGAASLATGEWRTSSL
jgi:hypothetical protein